MPTAEDYRNSAHECRSHAREAQDRQEREALLRMAAQWDRLAEHKARKEAEQASSTTLAESVCASVFQEFAFGNMGTAETAAEG